MPTYQYRCTTCDHQFEAVQSFSDASLTACPACSGVLRKVFSSVGIVFKGSGFYRTDSRSGSGGGEAKNGEAKNGAAASGAEKSGSGEDTKGSAATTKTGDGGSGSSSSSTSGSTSAPAAAAS